MTRVICSNSSNGNGKKKGGLNRWTCTLLFTSSLHVTPCHIKSARDKPSFFLIVNEDDASSSSLFCSIFLLHSFVLILPFFLSPVILFPCFVSVPGRYAIRKKHASCPPVLKSYIYARRTTDILYASFNRHIKRKLMHTRESARQCLHMQLYVILRTGAKKELRVFTELFIHFKGGCPFFKKRYFIFRSRRDSRFAGWRKVTHFLKIGVTALFFRIQF